MQSKRPPGKGRLMSTSVPRADGTAYTAAFGFFVLAAAFTAAWFVVIGMFAEAQDTGVRSVVTRIIIHAAILTGLWLALARTDFDPATRMRVWLAIAVPFIAWLAIVWWLAIAG